MLITSIVTDFSLTFQKSHQDCGFCTFYVFHDNISTEVAGNLISSEHFTTRKGCGAINKICFITVRVETVCVSVCETRHYCGQWEYS